jgi:transmembrane sensor
MSEESPVDEARIGRLEQATAWLQRMHASSGDERVLEEWLEWCQRDPRHQQAFDEMAVVWEATGRLDALSSPVATGVAQRNSWSRRALVASLSALTLSAVAGYYLWSRMENSATESSADFQSPIGTNSTHVLADGSTLVLGGGTRVSVVVGARERRVELHEGELFVSVRRDSRPFLVDTGRLAVVATGTAFNVLRTAARTTVTVSEGSVEARYADPDDDPLNVQLKTSQQLIYSHGAHSVEVRDVDPRNVLAWRSGQLWFRQEPLAEIIATLNRYTLKTLIIQDPRLAERRLSGTVNANDIDGSLEALQVSEPISIVELPDGRRLIGWRSVGQPD